MHPLRYVLLTVSVILILIIIIYLSLAFSIAKQAEVDTTKKSDVILVLGARSYIQGKYNPCLKARVDHAIMLYKKGYAQKILVTGGNDTEDNVNEAETMKKIAVASGVKPQDILLEKQATSTYENFTFSKQPLAKNNLHTIIIVTEPFHMERASLVAQKLKYDFTVSPAKDSPCWEPNKYMSKYFLKEPFAIAAYMLEDRVNLPWQ